jgi:putative toxin-antitoxin system antitoxin component (TIGR02293 family)
MTTKTQNFPHPAASQAAGFSWSNFFRHEQAGYDDLYVMSPIDRSVLVKIGAPSRSLTVIAKDMNIPRDRFIALIGVKRATAARKLASNSKLSADESERLVGIAKLIGQVESIVKESGNPENFKPARWFAQWIEESSSALGRRRPADLLDTADGREAVSRLLAQMQSGAYA